MNNHFLIIILFLFVAGCANPINRYTAAKYFEMGNMAEARGDLQAARESYRRATLNADWGMLGPGPKAHTLYEYGRVSGYLCDHKEAEFSLKESLRLQLSDKDVSSQLRAPTLLELARLHFDTGRKEEALPYYKEGVELVRQMDIEKTDPIRFTITLEEYADCLKAAGDQSEAEKVMEEAKTLRSGYNGPKIIKPFQRYADGCQNF